MFRHPPFPLAALLAAAALALPAAAEAADPPVAATYDAEFEGVYTYRATESSAGAMDATRATDVAWRSVARGLRLTRLPSDETSVRETEAPTVTASGSYHQVVYSDPPAVQDCVLSLAAPAPKGLVGARSEADRQVLVEFEPAQRVDMTKACTTPTRVPEETLLGANLTGKATFSRDRVGDAEIVLPVESPASLPCPAYALTTSCEASWRGRITLTRTAVEDAPKPKPPVARPPAGRPSEDELIVPLVPAPMDDLFVPLVPRKQVAKIGPRGTLRFRARCTRGCSGTVTVRPVGRRAPAAPAVRVRVPARAGTQVVAVDLPRAARRPLRGRRTATVSLALTAAGSDQTTRARLVGRVA